MVTIYDIAKKMRLSHTTVSMALRGLPCVKESTREKVAVTAERLGYRKNQVALSLKRGSFRRIALILHGYDVYDELISTLERRCGEDGYELVLMHLDEAPDKMRRTFEQVVDGGYAGAAAYLYNYRTVAGCVNTFIDGRRPFIALNIPPDLEPRAGLFRFDVDAGEAMREVIAKLFELGHRNIVSAVMRPAFNSYEPEKYYKYRILCEMLASRKISTPWSPGFFYNSRYPIDHIQDGYDAADRILSEKPGVTAILCKNDYFAFGLMRRFRECGVRVPQDISLVATDNTKLAKFSPVQLTSIDLHQHLMAEKIWEVFSSAFRAPGFTETAPETVFRAELVLRESCGKAPPSAATASASSTSTSASASAARKTAKKG